MITISTVHLPVLNSLLFIRDATLADTPEIDGLSDVWSIPTCIAVGCLPDCDGTTEVTIGAGPELEGSGSLLFDGRLETPSRTVIVETVLWQKILEKIVPGAATRVRIWTNRRRAPDKVIIGLD
jgi:hypothetical protein